MSSAPSAVQLAGPELFALDFYFNESDSSTPHRTPQTKHGIKPLSVQGHRAYSRMWRAKIGTTWQQVLQEDLHLGATQASTGTGAGASTNAFTINVCYPDSALPPRDSQPILENVQVQLSTFYKCSSGVTQYCDPSSTFAGYAYSSSLPQNLTPLPALDGDFITTPPGTPLTCPR